MKPKQADPQIVSSQPTVTEESVVRATHGSPDHPLKLGNIMIACYVLEDGRRVLVQGGMITALAMSQGTAGRGGGDRLAKFIRGKAVFPFIPDHVQDLINQPIKFRTPMGGLAYGYEASLLSDLCDALITAHKTAKLNYQTVHIAEQAEILSKGFRHVGIIALIDEATGFQAERARDALEKILDLFLAKEYGKWAKMFPDEFYMQMFRLRGWPYDPASVKRPALVGSLTNDVVYDRLAPGILKELRDRNPPNKHGRRKHKHFQWLTEDIGHPRLREHLHAVITLMKVAKTWPQFYGMLQQALPRWEDQLQQKLLLE